MSFWIACIFWNMVGVLYTDFFMKKFNIYFEYYTNLVNWSAIKNIIVKTVTTLSIFLKIMRFLLCPLLQCLHSENLCELFQLKSGPRPFSDWWDCIYKGGSNLEKCHSIEGKSSKLFNSWFVCRHYNLFTRNTEVLSTTGSSVLWRNDGLTVSIM